MEAGPGQSRIRLSGPIIALSLLLLAGAPWQAIARPAPLGGSPLAVAGGFTQRTVAFGFAGSPPVLAFSGPNVILVDENRMKVQAMPVNAGTLAVGRPGRLWDEPPMTNGESVRLFAAAAGAGWVVAKETSSGGYTDVSLFTADAAGTIVKSAPAGESAAPVRSANGTTWPGGELISDVHVQCIAGGGPDGRVLVGVELAGERRWKDRDHQLAFAFVDAGGHVVVKPVAAGWFLPPGVPAAGTPATGGFLVAHHIETFTGNAYDHGPEVVKILRVAPDGSATLTDTWDVPKPNGVYPAVNSLVWACAGGRREVVYGGPWGIWTAAVDADGRRAGVPRVLVAPARADGVEIVHGRLLAAELLRGHVRALVSDPVRLIDLGPDVQAVPRTLLQFRRDAAPWSAALRDGTGWVAWSRGDWPPPYLTRFRESTK